MRQAGSASAHAAASAPSFGATEKVTRPDPGLARGAWEAPPWAFWLALALVLVGSGLYLARRLGLLHIKKTAPSDSPPSKRGARS